MQGQGFGYQGPTETAANPEALARRFRSFAYTEAEETSPLYHHLALAVAEDAELLNLAAHTRAGQPPANMLLGAVHLLLLGGAAHPLAAYYPSLAAEPLPPANAFPAFRDFCLAHRSAIAEILPTRFVQTNEVARCAYLLPAFARAAELAGGQPLALIEIGASAGLNLLFDRYRICYSCGSYRINGGAAVSPVIIRTALQWPADTPEAQAFDFPLGQPTIAQRIGIDLHVVDGDNEAAYAWLRALIWPEHGERAQRLEAARNVWRSGPPQLMEGDATQMLGQALAAIPTNHTPVIFHTHVLNQFTPQAAAALDAIITDAAQRRLILRIGNDLGGDPGGGSGKSYLLRLRCYTQGRMTERILARVDGHARQIVWYAAADQQVSCP